MIRQGVAAALSANGEGNGAGEADRDDPATIEDAGAAGGATNREAGEKEKGRKVKFGARDIRYR